MTTDYKSLLDKAKKAAENAYAPYSKFYVGACVLFEDGSEYVGTNVENASYGLALCAERSAIASAISQGQKSKLKAIAIASKNTAHCSPCGACRQWIFEFNKQADIILEGENSEAVVYKIAELLPHGFEF